MTDRLRPPAYQLQLLGAKHPMDMGNHVIGFGNDPTLFDQHYTSPAYAKADYEASSKTCRTYPPLRIRVDESDQSIPVRILSGAELQVTEKIPDIILHFHKASKAVTISACEIPPEKSFLFQRVMTLLYSLEVTPVRWLTQNEFLKLYDTARSQMIRKLQIARPIQKKR